MEELICIFCDRTWIFIARCDSLSADDGGCEGVNVYKIQNIKINVSLNV